MIESATKNRNSHLASDLLSALQEHGKQRENSHPNDERYADGCVVWRNRLRRQSDVVRNRLRRGRDNDRLDLCGSLGDHLCMSNYTGGNYYT